MVFSNKTISDIEFLIALSANAVLLFIQMWRLYKTKNHYGLSLVTFVGFLLIQISGVINGFYNADFALIIGYGLSTLINFLLVMLIIYYRWHFPKQDTLRNDG